jgi:type IV pilus assembly protein PilE
MKATSMRMNRGVTLIELMTVMIIVAILAAIAVPSYRQYTIKTHRASARACLAEAAQFMERFYTSNMTYEDATIALNCETEGGLNTHYTIAPTATAQRTYTLSATPRGAQLSSDPGCGTLTLQEDGTRGAGDNSEAAIARCW